MLGIKKYLIGAVAGLAVGLWVGVNIGHDRPLWANPFSQPSLQEKAKNTARDAWKGAKEAARDKLSD